MAKATHSPGPWSLGPWAAHLYERGSCVVDAREIPVAHVYGLNHPDPAIVAMSIPNRDLIAAAPDLLAACQHALKMISGKGYHGEALIKAAIAKAKGGA